ncbi:MAG: hypothetical protein HQL26_05500 [Candidatus Omnitrophica bacterium]|nr:hypothetical protein [Candidatus Omnitrophota bacterium]
MLILFALIVILAFCGVGYVLWVLKTEGKKSTLTPSAPTEKTELTSEDLLIKYAPAPQIISIKSESHKLSQAEDDLISEEIHAAAELHELKEKYMRLEKIFNEKKDELERVHTELNVELRTKKEFNKVKDILEKELKEVKDRAKEYKVELTAVQAELQNQLKRSSAKTESIPADENANPRFPEIKDAIDRFDQITTTEK